MDWFQAILFNLLIIVLAYWMSGWFISDQRRAEDAPPVWEEAPVPTEDRKEKARGCREERSAAG